MRPSRLTRARGLKLRQIPSDLDGHGVAPHAGAWIETLSGSNAGSIDGCRASRGRVD